MPRARPKGFDELAFYAEHFDTVEVNSTFYGQPRAEVSRSVGGADAAGLRVLDQAVPEVHAPGDVHGSALTGELPLAPEPDDACLDALAAPNQADLDEFRAGIDPLASSGKLGALLAQFPPSFKNDAGVGATTSPACCARSATTRWPSSCGTGAGATTSADDARAAQRVRRRVGADRRAEVPVLDPAELPAERAAASTTCGCTAGTPPQWWRHEKAEDRYNYLYSADELKAFAETADAARRLVKKVYLYTNNHFSAKSVANAAMIKQQLGEPIEGEYPPEFVERYPELAGVGPRRPIRVTASRTSF